MGYGGWHIQEDNLVGLCFGKAVKREEASSTGLLPDQLAFGVQVQSCSRPFPSWETNGVCTVRAERLVAWWSVGSMALLG